MSPALRHDKGEKMLKSHLYPLLALLAPLFLIAACSSGEPAATATPTVTPTAFPTFAFVQYTTVPEVAAAATEAAATAAVSDNEFVLDEEKAGYGLGRWEALECGSCHGETGEGTDDGGPLLEYNADEDAFIDFMRTGGDLGVDHLYPAERLSNSGISNLYHYVRSLGE